MSAVPIAPASAAAWLKQIGRPWRRLTLLTGVLTIADVAPAIGFAAGLALTISSLTVSPAAAAPWLALAVFSLIARGLIGQAAVIVGAKLGRAVKTDVRGRLLSDLFGRGRRSSAQMTALVEGVGSLDGYYSRFAPLRLAARVSPLLIIAAAAIASPVSAGILLFTLFPFIVGMALAGTAAAGESRRQFQALERLSGLFIDRIRTLPAILAFDAVGHTTVQIAQASDEMERRTARVMRIAFLSSGVLEFFSALSVALIAAYCGFNLLRLLPFPVPETLDLSRAFFVLALAPEVYAPLRRLAAAYHDRQAAEAAAPSLIRPDPRPAQRAPIGDLAPAIHFRDVAIAYEGSATVIDGFDLDIAPGQLVAVMGASGAGKSSLLHLILGVTPLSSGIIEIGDHPLPPAGFAGAVGWASQAPVVIPGTLGDNIRIARRDACDSDVRRAAGEAGLTGDLDRRLDERGGGLSGGERRRLGLARALLSSSKVLLLDEPTANLDRETETELIEVLRCAARGRTTLIATHSEAVIALADRVVRL